MAAARCAAGWEDADGPCSPDSNNSRSGLAPTVVSTEAKNSNTAQINLNIPLSPFKKIGTALSWLTYASRHHRLSFVGEYHACRKAAHPRRQSRIEDKFFGGYT
jgi:hypothetical protein